nr:aldolase/citrate lyase family protein [Curvibacter sp. CHRR-16]
MLQAQGGSHVLPVCDHYSGVPARMEKSLQLQAQWAARMGVCVFDVTLDCEDGAPVGDELRHAKTVVELIQSAVTAPEFVAIEQVPRIGVRVHALDHPAFAHDVQTIVGAVGGHLAYVMVPKVESVRDVQTAVAHIDAAVIAAGAVLAAPLPLHVLIESPLAVRHVWEIAAHPRVQSVSFGLMDFVSAHGGAIPQSAMGVAGLGSTDLDQFHHPLVLRAKLEIASACHAYGKVPSHCVVTEFRRPDVLRAAASHAHRALGYSRMWSIHPDQIEPIVQAFAPSDDEIAQAADVLRIAQAADWAPIAVQGRLHDRASYRYFWHVLQRAHHGGRVMPAHAQSYFA